MWDDWLTVKGFESRGARPLLGLDGLEFFGRASWVRTAGDNGSLQPMAEAAQAATGGPAQPINVVADAGYSNGKQAEACDAKGILPHVPANRSVTTRGDGTLFNRTEFTYQP